MCVGYPERYEVTCIDSLGRGADFGERRFGGRWRVVHAEQSAHAQRDADDRAAEDDFHLRSSKSATPSGVLAELRIARRRANVSIICVALGPGERVE
jgi:hypothetical protein